MFYDPRIIDYIMYLQFICIPCNCCCVETLCTTRVRETFLVLASVPGPVFLSLFQYIKQLMLFVLDENLTDFCVKTLLRLNIPSRFLR